MPDVTLAAVIGIVCLAILFDYSNGFHDAANSIATVVSTRVLHPRLAGAIAWNITTWWLGLPTSSSHALIGGFVGAGVAKAGWSVVNGPSLQKTVIFIVLSPTLGLVVAFGLMVVLVWSFHSAAPRRVDRTFRRLQLVSAAAVSLGQ